MRVSLIAAVASNGVIGKDNDLIWHLPEDLKFFKESTLGKPVIMGRLNFESIPERFRPLPGRLNVVLTRSSQYDAGEGVLVYNDLEKCLMDLESKGLEEVFVIGGGQVYKQALQKGLVDRMYITHVDLAPEGDTFFPAFDEGDWEVNVLKELPADDRHEASMSFVRYDRKA